VVYQQPVQAWDRQQRDAAAGREEQKEESKGKLPGSDLNNLIYLYNVLIWSILFVWFLQLIW